MTDEFDSPLDPSSGQRVSNSRSKSLVTFSYSLYALKRTKSPNLVVSTLLRRHPPTSESEELIRGRGHLTPEKVTR